MQGETQIANLPVSRAGSATFKTTHWSGLRSARQGEAGGVSAEEALANLCRDYWYPLYAYVRGCHFSPEDAQDITQAFFERLIERDLLAAADPARGRFRWFLLTALQNFLRNEIERAKAQKRGGQCDLVSWDALEAEQRYAAEPTDGGTPDRAFDRSWGRVVLARAMGRLGEEQSSAGRGPVFDELKQCLGAVPGEGLYRGAAERLGLSAAAVKVTVHRLRERYRELVRDEIARTVADPVDVDDELRHLAELLAH